MYVVKKDTGFAPNPFHGWCTLACCKPAIRRRAKAGDWIVGVAPKSYGNGIVYAMRVEETITFAEYWRDRRFASKRPRWGRALGLVERNGDNCYQPDGRGGYRQQPSMHWDKDNDREDLRHKTRDLSGEHVLVARRFSYFGKRPQALSPALSPMKLPARFNRVKFTPQERAALLLFLRGLPRGVRARPRHWKTEDASWRQGGRSCD
jgi:hypothetical protein